MDYINYLLNNIKLNMDKLYKEKDDYKIELIQYDIDEDIFELYNIFNMIF